MRAELGWLAPLEEQLSAWGISIPAEYVVLGLLAAVLVVVIGTVLWRRLRRTPAERLQTRLADEDAVTVLLHPNPDPDAMATGMAVAAIADGVDTEATLAYPGQLRHHENRAFRTVLEVDLDRIEHERELGDGPVVLVDHGRPRGFGGAQTIEPLAIIDHHDDEPIDAPHVDVRPDYGACSTIVLEYLRDLSIAGEDGPLAADEALSTALLYGIHTDTNNLTRGVTNREFAACEFLYPRVDEDALDRIANPPIEAHILEAKARAITNRLVQDCYCVADVGQVEAVDAIPMAAEELLRLEGVTATVVVGEHDGHLHISGRSVDDRVHMGKALERAVAAIPDAGAGGHARMGGGQIPVEGLDGIGPTTGMSREDLTDAFFEHMRETV